ncbi:MAG: hypothetical protein JXQ73_20390 [Phycisphaerae bacterium]|nr:hypothetical protein [Phycisphaerae bacterium]
MGATLDALHRLQAIESRLHALRQRIEGKRREIRVQTRRLNSIKESDQQQHDRTQHLQADIDRLELDRKSRENEIIKLREQMKITKTNKEYAAIRVQINTLDANNRKLEDRILELMGQADELKTQSETIQDELRQQGDRLSKLDQELAEIESETEPQIAELQEQREEATMHVPASALQTFELVSEHRDSDAMAKMVRPNAKRDEFICNGCHMSQPLETVNAIMNKDEVQTCKVCGRILYLEEPATTDRATTS